MANLKPLPAPILLEKDAPPRGSENVQLVRETFNRKEFNDTINTTVGDFFTIYQNLFYSIPKGNIISGEEINSHIFLIERSTAYTNFVSQQEEIDALAQEITDLRAQNLELVADMANIVEGFEQTVANLTEQING